jgi:Uma2 family endonuclease
MEQTELDLMASERLRPISRADYHRMAEIGVFEEGERVELLRGMLVVMSPQGGRHVHATSVLMERLVLALQGRAKVRVQMPVAACDDSEPEPDVAVVQPGDYLEDHPSSAHLIVEVSGDTLKKDRGLKAALYAAMNVPEYWIVNLVDRVVEIHTSPGPTGYAQVEALSPGATRRLLAFPDVEIEIAALLPPPR